jgi:imidazolonepropionase-like amidohydrolase
LTPYQVLQTATSNAARFLGTNDDTGTIAKGKIADLVLLDAKPLMDVDNVFRQAGVMLHGHWFPEDELQTKLSEAVSVSRASVHP